MKPILVHIHVYYTELWKELESCLHNLVAYPCEIYVTYVKDDATSEAQHFIFHLRNKRCTAFFNFFSLPLPWVRKESLCEE